MDITIFSGLLHPTKSLSRIGGRHAVKTLSSLISRPVLDLCFYEANVTTRYWKDIVRKFRYS
jgi:hypothetical protein